MTKNNVACLVALEENPIILNTYFSAVYLYPQKNTAYLL